MNRPLPLLVFAAALAGGSIDAAPLRVTATTSIVGDIVRTVAGTDAEVSVLIPRGSDPHVFEPTPGDIRRLSDSDVIFINGAGLEEGIERTLDTVRSDRGMPIVDLSEGLPLRGSHDECAETDHEHHHHHHEVDPHVWLDPMLVARWVPRIAAELAAFRPDAREGFEARGAALVRDLEALDAWIREQTKALPAERRAFVTDHDEFGYFAARYGFHVAGSLVDTVTTAAEASARNIAELEDGMSRDEVRVIVLGHGANPALADRVAADTGAVVLRLHTGSLGPVGSPAGTYIGMMRDNVAALVGALAGSAP